MEINLDAKHHVIRYALPVIFSFFIPQISKNAQLPAEHYNEKLHSMFSLTLKLSV